MRLLLLAVAAAAGWMLGTRQNRREMDDRFAELEDRLGLRNGEPDEVWDDEEAGLAPPPRSAAPEPGTAAATVAQTAAAPAPSDEVTPEIIAVLSAAVAAYLGKRARVKSVRRVAQGGVSAWTQQGRVHIQGSHNLVRQ
jgi:methylmalonyl-CoA carboxyltransferase 12S subunit